MSHRHITLDAVREAARTVYRAATRTPLIRLDLSDIPDAPELYLKLELLQPIGSFKVRGAYNAMCHLSPAVLAGGVWTVSAGNAAQGVALAARILGAPCSVLVSDTAPRAKLDAIARLGAAVVLVSYDECWRAVVDHDSPRMDGHFVHPFDDDRFIAGNGTLALEILEDLPDVDAVVASVGGGGLLAGLSAVMRATRPTTRIYGAEPVTASPLAASFAEGRPVSFQGWTASFVDGAGGQSVLATMWPLLRNVDESLVVTLDDVAAAMRLTAQRARVILEGAAGCAVAAALSGRAGRGKVVAVASGGNIDLARFASIVGACPPRESDGSLH